MRPRPPTPSLGVDFGTSNTIAVVHRADGSARPLLFDGAPLMPSAVCSDGRGGLLVGRDAVHSGRRHPERFEPNPKRHIDREAVLLGDREFPVVELIAGVLSAVAEECRRVVGSPRQVTVTVPAEWGPARRRVVENAAARSGLGRVRLVPEPVAAATYFAESLGRRIAPGSSIVVYDLGAGTFDASVVRRTEHGFETVALDGRSDLGGIDIDAALIDHLAHTYGGHTDWGRLTDPSTVEERRAFRDFQDEIRAAKERLSRHQQADVAIPLLEVEAHLTRAELERIAAPHLEQTIEVTRAVLAAAGIEAGQSAGVFLVGGASRMPLVATMLHRALGVAPVVLDQPEVVVAEGSGLWSEPSRPSPPPITPQQPPRPAAPAGPRIMPQAAAVTPQRRAPDGPPPERPLSEAEQAARQRRVRTIITAVIVVNVLLVVVLVIVFGDRREADSAEGDGDEVSTTDRPADESDTYEQISEDLQAHESAVTAIAAAETEQGLMIFTAGEGEVKQWNAETDELVASTPFPQDVNAMTLMEFSDGPRVVAVDGALGVHAWDPATFEVETLTDTLSDSTPERILPCTVDGHAAFAVMTSDEYGLADLETLEVVSGHEYTTEQLNAYRNFAVVDGEAKMVVAHADGSLRLFDVETGEPDGGPFGPDESTWTSDNLVSALQVVETGETSYARVFDDQGFFHTWDLRSEEPYQSPSDSGEAEDRYLRETVEIEGEEILLTYGGSDTAELHPVGGGEAAGSLTLGSGATITAAATATIDGYTIAITGSDEGTVQLWDLGG